MEKVEDIRGQFPHTRELTYLNHAATGPVSSNVRRAIDTYLEERSVSHVENYFEFEHTIKRTLERIAQLIGTTTDQVEFVPNTSYGINILAEGYPWEPGDRIAIPSCEFPTNVYPFLHQKRKGVEVDFIQTREGMFNMDDVRAALTPRTKVVSVSWVQFLSGYRAPLKQIGDLCKERGILFCVDAIQGLGALELNVEEASIDFLACGGHKWLMAAQGIGFVYVTPALRERITSMAGWLHGPVDWANLTNYSLAFHENARRYRLGTVNSMGIAALDAALAQYFDAGPAWCEEHILTLAGLLSEGLQQAGFEPYGARDHLPTSGIVTFKHPASEALFTHLKEMKIIVAVRNGLVRVAPTFYNSENEIHTFLEQLNRFGAAQ